MVLLGYQADDPPVSYLLQGLESVARQHPDRLFAFYSGDPKGVDAKWKARHVHAIPYGDNHDTLWETLEAWAVRADNPTSWRSSVVETSRKGPRALKPHERGMVAQDIPASVAKDARFENARQNSDRENARVESDKATERAVLAMMQDDTQLFKLFADNPDFRRWLADTAFRLAYEATD